jgi:AcrR family transcriptional regulator
MDNLRTQIIHEASLMFQQFGIRSVSIDNICKTLSISKKTFYVHFGQKDLLVDAVLDYQELAIQEKFAKLLKDKNAIESLIIIIKEIRKNVDSEYQSMCFDLQKYHPKIYQKHEQRKLESMKIGFEMNLKQGIDEGFYRKDLDLELTSLFHSIQLKKSFEIMELSPKKYTKKRLVDFFIDLIVHLIANENGLKYMDENYYKTE